MAELLHELLERCRRNDPEAIGVLVRRFQRWAQELAEAFLCDEHLAEDAVQAAFVRALAQLNDLREAAAFPGWFRQVIRTECHRIARKRRPIEEVKDCVASDAPSPPAEMEAHDQQRIVGEALKKLSPADRQTVELYYWEQFACAEVAERLGIPEGTVKRRLHDARLRLRQLLLDS